MKMPLALGFLCIMLGSSAATAAGAGTDEVSRLNAGIQKFADIELTVDLAGLPANERQALAKMVAAAQVMDALFIEQVWGENPSTLARLSTDTSLQGLARLKAFLLNKGPWSRLDHDAPFLAGVPNKPDQASFYPIDATKAEIEKWWNGLSGAAQKDAKGFFTTVRRDQKGKLHAVPYSTEYQAQLQHAARLLDEAAALSTQPTLKDFLTKRAKAFRTNYYYESEIAWMNLDASIEPTIGPYEVYEDGWFNAKAAFEAFITLRDEAESNKLKRLSAELQELENALPIDDKYKSKKLGALAPIRVVNVVVSSGDGNRGVQTAAFNLPNDERVVKEKGSKRVMLKNYQEAKFKRVLLPIADVALPQALVGQVSFDSFFTFILMHELMHGLGPHEIKVGGKNTTPREQLKETYSAIEEAKADVTGLWAMQKLMNKGVLDKAMANTMYVTFLASAFRSVRFGLNEAHGKATALQVNTLLDAGAFTVAADGRFSVANDKMVAAVEKLATTLLMIEAEGNYAAANKLITEQAVVRPQVKAILDRLDKVPVDIAPRFVTAAQLLEQDRNGKSVESAK